MMYHLFAPRAAAIDNAVSRLTLSTIEATAGSLGVLPSVLVAALLCASEQGHEVDA